MTAVAEEQATGRSSAEWRATRSAHQELTERAERLERLLEALAVGASTAGDELRIRLKEFRRRFLAHLDVEERSGVLERAAVVEPRFARRVEQLCLEHRDLRRAADGLAAELGASSARPDWAVVRVRFSAFRRVLQKHERAENDVLHGAYLEDIGGGD